MRALFAGLAALWCEWMHGGGWVLRDPAGRVNWQCRKCGRWAEPVSESDEANLLKRHMERREADYFAQMDAEEAPDDEAKCPECDGDGGDKWNDYSLPCPTCGGDGRLW